VIPTFRKGTRIEVRRKKVGVIIPLKKNKRLLKRERGKGKRGSGQLEGFFKQSKYKFRGGGSGKKNGHSNEDDSNVGEEYINKEQLDSEETNLGGKKE